MKFRVFLLLSTIVYHLAYALILSSIMTGPSPSALGLFLFFIVEFCSLLLLFKLHADHAILSFWTRDLFTAASIGWIIGSLCVLGFLASRVTPYMTYWDVLFAMAMPLTLIQSAIYFGGVFAGIKLSPHSDRVKRQLLFIILRTKQSSFTVPELADRIGKSPSLVIDALRSLIHDGSLIGYLDLQTGELAVSEA